MLVLEWMEQFCDTRCDETRQEFTEVAKHTNIFVVAQLMPHQTFHLNCSAHRQRCFHFFFFCLIRLIKLALCLVPLLGINKVTRQLVLKKSGDS